MRLVQVTKRRILHLITGLDAGGAENALLKTLPKLEKRFVNRVFCITGRGRIGAELSKQGIPVFYLDLTLGNLGRSVFKYRRIIHDFKPDLQVNYLPHADLFGRFFGRLFGIPKIVSFLRAKLLEPRHQPLLWVDRLTQGLVDHYFAVSAAVKSFYIKNVHIPAHKITVIPNSTDPARMAVKINKKAKKSQLGLKQNDRVLLYVARLRTQKNHLTLLKSIKLLLTSEPRVKLLLAGDGGLRSKLEQYALDHNLQDNVFFLGDRQDIAELLAITDIFVFPTFYEGMPNALLEAMAAGRAIVASNIEENQELIKHGKSGLLVAVNNHVELAHAVKKLLQNKTLSKKLGNAAKSTVNTRYTISVTTKLLERHIERLLA